MKLISLSNLLTRASETFRRFPLPLLSAMATTVVMICVMETNDSGNHELNQGYWRIAFSLSLFTILSLAISLALERFSAKKTTVWIAYGAAVVAAIGYFFSLPVELVDANSIRWAAMAIAVHLMVSFAPFLFRNEMNGMWQFNKSLFIHFLTGGVYSGVLFAGLAGALAAIDALFDVHVESKFYADLWFVIAGTFNTWFFLSGVPRDLSSLEHATDYPKGLKVFTVHVLLPLISVYMIILYLYAAKILITQNWPVGWVAYMVIAFSGVGILSFLLVYPLRNDEANRWVTVYSRLFYYLLILPIVMLYISIFKRITMYGWTVDRYFVVLLALWLTYITVYLIITNGRKIRMIPLSLCVVALLSTFGPWGAFDVSRNSQIGELTDLFTKHKMLSGGKVNTSEHYEIIDKDAERIRSVVNYLVWMHGHQSLQPLFTENLDSVVVKNTSGEEQWQSFRNTEAITSLMKIKEIKTHGDTESSQHYEVSEQEVFRTGDFDFVAEYGFSVYRERTRIRSEKHYITGSDTVRIVMNDDSTGFTLTCGNRVPLDLLAEPMLKALLDESQQVPASLLEVNAENEQWKAKLCISTVNTQYKNGKVTIDDGHSLLMVKFKDAK